MLQTVRLAISILSNGVESRDYTQMGVSCGSPAALPSKNVRASRDIASPSHGNLSPERTVARENEIRTLYLIFSFA